MSLDIIPVQAQDVDAISALAREIWQEHYLGIITQEQIDYMLGQRYNRTHLLKEIADPAIEWWQACADGRRVGFASLIAGNDEATRKLDKLYVHPDAQRQGIGKALIEFLAARAKGAGCETLILAVNKRNEKAIAAYRKHGFTLREAVRVDIGQGFVMDDFIMSKPL
jgi:diamine N-acetyltransferase